MNTGSAEIRFCGSEPRECSERKDHCFPGRRQRSIAMRNGGNQSRRSTSARINGVESGGVVVAEREKNLAVARPANVVLVVRRVGQSPKVAAVGVDDVHIRVSITIRGEGD